MTAEGVAWIDGGVVPLADARLPATDRGFLFADSVFDTVRTYDRRPFLLGDHLDRLRASAATLELPVPWSDDALGAVVDALLAAHGDEASLRIMVTRGDGGAGLAFPEPQRPRLVALCRPLTPPPEAAYLEGVSVVRPAQGGARGRGVPAHVKSGSYLANVLVLAQARRRGAFEGLLLADDGSWSEATTSNLFAVRGGALRTPARDGDILPGVTRALVMMVAASLGVPVEEGPLSDDALEGADELLITSSIKEVLPVTRLDDRPVGEGVPGPVTRRLMVGFRAAARALSGVARLPARLPLS